MDKLASLKQIAELDRVAMEEAGLDILQMMEMAGNKFALIVKDYFKDLKNKKILILSGTGHNGGDGLSAARYLNNWGASVIVVIAKKNLKPASQHHLNILTKMGISVNYAPGKLPKNDLIIDALLGYNQQSDAQAPYNDLINKANKLKTPIFSFDNPSGLDIETGNPSNPTIKAIATITLAIFKKGLKEKTIKDYVGNLFLVDIGIPKWVYEKVGLYYPFEKMRGNFII